MGRNTAGNTVERGHDGRFRDGNQAARGNSGGGRLPREFRARCREFMDEEGWDLLAKMARGGQGDLRVQLEALKFIARMGADLREGSAEPSRGINIPAWRNADSP